MSEADWSYLNNGLDIAAVDRGVTAWVTWSVVQVSTRLTRFRSFHNISCLAKVPRVASRACPTAPPRLFPFPAKRGIGRGQT